jgi:long-chain fatty acid transport protein
MRRKTLLWIFLSTSLVVLMSAGSVFAAGFALYEGSARGLVLGAGMTGSADDAAAVFYNPAGITQLKGVQTMFGVTAINPEMNITTSGYFAPSTIGPTGLIPNPQPSSGGVTGMEHNVFFPPHAYVTSPITDRIYGGLGVFSRFGLGTEYTGDWPGRYNSTKATIKTLELNPNVAFKVADGFSLAAGVSAMWFDANLQKKLDTRVFGVGDTNFELDGDSWGYGFNLAAHWKATDWVSAGISYRSRVKQNIDGGSVNVSRQIPAAGIVNTTGSVDITLPSEIFAGVTFKVLKNLSIGGGVYWTEWSTYDNLALNFNSPFAGRTSQVIPKNWEDVFRYMIGVEWNMTPNWDLRLSYAYDEAPEPDSTIDYQLPDNDRQQFTIGVGYHNGPWLVDLAYMYILFSDRDVAARPADYILQGKFEGYADLLSLSFGYKF